ncbi:MAG: VWA domain-containing protein [Acidobacteriota bacterium]
MTGLKPAFADSVEATAEVTLVEVPVEVLNADGEPVRGLGLEDFELLDRGVPQVISELVAVDRGVDPNTSQTSKYRASASSPRRILLLFDVVLSQPSAVDRARSAARELVLTGLASSDLVAVMTLSLDGPQMLMSFTSDRMQLARALDALASPELLATAQVGDPLSLTFNAPSAAPELEANVSRRLPGSGQTAAGGETQQEVMARLRAIDRQVEGQAKRRSRDVVEGWSKALAELGRILGSLRGRKHVLYFSEGFDSGLLLGDQGDSELGALQHEDLEQESLTRERGERWLRQESDDFGFAPLRESIRRAGDAFSAADAVVDTIDISGLVATSGTGRRARRSSLQSLARSTGGQHYGGTSSLVEALERALERSAYSYVLRFYPRPLEWDGSYHELEVGLSGPAGLPRRTRLWHRPGYHAPRPFQELHPLEKRLLAADAVMTVAPRRELEMNVLLAAFESTPGAYVPVMIEVDGPSLLVGQRSDRLEVEFFVYATDSRGTLSDFLSHRVAFDLQRVRRRLTATGLKFYGDLELGPEQYRVRVLVRNAETGRTSVWAKPLERTQPDAATPRLLPPFFVDTRDDWLLAREPVTGDQVIYPFLWDEKPFIPAVLPRLERRSGFDFMLVAYGFEAGPLALEIRAVPQDEALAGGSVELLSTELLTIEKSGERSLLQGRFDASNLALGAYRLETIVRHEQDHQQAKVISQITVVE